MSIEVLPIPHSVIKNDILNGFSYVFIGDRNGEGFHFDKFLINSEL